MLMSSPDMAVSIHVGFFAGVLVREPYYLGMYQSGSFLQTPIRGRVNIGDSRAILGMGSFMMTLYGTFQVRLLLQGRSHQGPPIYRYSPSVTPAFKVF